MKRRRSHAFNASTLELLEHRHMLSGSPLGLDSNTTHEVAAASSSTSAIDFFRLSPFGGLGSASLENTGTVTDAASDEVDFTFFAENGEVISALVTPTNPAAIITVELVEGSVDATAAAPGEFVVLPSSTISTTGLSTLRVTSNLPTDFSTDIYRNTVLESSVGESSPANRVDLEPSELSLDGVQRYFGVGKTSLEPSETTLFSESFDGAVAFSTEDLWHMSAGRANDGQPNHAGSAFYFGQAELADDQTGTFNWDAALDSTANSIWESTDLDRTATRWTFDSTSNPGTSGPTSNLAGITKWYTFGPRATMDAIEDSRGDGATEADASFELVFRARDFDGTHILFETGGNGDGTTILLVGETLEVRVQDADDPARRVIRNYTLDTANDVDKFHHVAVTIHPDEVIAASQVRLFVNGVEVGSPVSATGDLSDWAGSDNSGLGTVNSAFSDSNDTILDGNFDGDIALLRYHEGRLLTVGEVSATYGHLVNNQSFVKGNYNTGAAVGGDATSDPISLVGGTEYTLSFDTLIDVEEAEEPFERLQVLVRNTATSHEEILLDRFDGTLPESTGGQWSNVEVDLTEFAGQSVQVLFRFDSVDGSNNNFEGWWIDNVHVTRSEPEPSADDDQFTVDLTDSVGQMVDIVLAGQANADYSAQLLELRGPGGGALLAMGASDPMQSGTDARNYDLGIMGYQVTSPGIYTVRVVSDAAMVGEEYGVLVTSGATMETEPNEASDPLRSLSTSSTLGYLRTDSVEVYSNRGAFDADNSDLPVEDFEGGVVDSGGVVSFVGPLNNQTANVAFPSGIMPGMQVNSGTTSTADLALVGSDFFDEGDPGSKAVGPESFASNTNITFTQQVTAVGFDILGIGDVTVRLYDQAGGIVLSSVVASEPTGTFFGAASTEPIRRVEVIEMETIGELIDNVAFGTAGVSPAPDTDSFVVSLAAGQSVQLETATPFDAVDHSPLNDLNPRLDFTGPGVNLSDVNSAADGKNAAISFTADVAGDYVIQVSAESGEGEYAVHVDVAPTSCEPSQGDVDGDGVVGFSDFLVLSSEFGTDTDPLRSDLDCDGAVGFSDFLILSGSFGTNV